MAFFDNENLQWIRMLLILLLFTMALVIIIDFRKRQKRKLVGYVSKLYCYPVKSCGRVDSSKMEVTNHGPKHDRQFVLLNRYGTFMTLRRYPKLVLVRPSITEEGIYLEANDMPILQLPLEMKKEEGEINPKITIWRKTTAGVHVSEDADEWFSKYLQVPGCKLFCFPKGGLPRYAADKGVQMENYTNENDTCMFADGTPILLLSESSVEDFRMNVSCDNFTVERFRPNIVISGSTPFAEDDWIFIEIGDVRLMNLYPCDRCVAVNVDPFTAEVNRIVENTLKKYRPPPEQFHGINPSGSIFGCNYGVRKTGHIKVGDPIYLVS